MKKTAFAVALLLMPIAFITTAHADDGLACLQDKVKVSAASVEKEDYGTSLNFSISNGLKWAVRSVIIEYKITSEGRSVPWKEGNLATQIEGGIEPGETRSISIPLSISADAPEKVQMQGNVIDVADAEKRPLIGKPSVMGNSDDLTPLGCN